MVAFFTPPPFMTTGPSDPAFSSVTLLSHFDGANAQTTFTDSSSKAVPLSANGGAKLSTAISKFGSASLSLNGSTDYVTAPASDNWTFGTGDFTIECWAYLTSISADRCFASNYISTPSGWFFRYIQGAGLNFGFANTTQINKAYTFTANTWTHVALSRVSGVLYFFASGVLLGSNAYTTDIAASTQPLAIGRTQGVNTGYLAGNIDDFRITKGIGRYTASFTPPTSAFLDR